MNPMRYVQLAVLFGVIGLAISTKILWDNNQELKETKRILEVQAENNAANMVLFSEALKREQEIREEAQTALSELGRDVPDVIYSQELPPSIQGVLDRFHDSIRP